VATLLAIERYVPPYRYAQEEVSRYVEEWLVGDAAVCRLLSVYASAGVSTRASPEQPSVPNNPFSSRNGSPLADITNTPPSLSYRPAACDGRFIGLTRDCVISESTPL
jgi:hypothetical protein